MAVTVTVKAFPDVKPVTWSCMGILISPWFDFSVSVCQCQSEFTVTLNDSVLFRIGFQVHVNQKHAGGGCKWRLKHFLLDFGPRSAPLLPFRALPRWQQFPLLQVRPLRVVSPDSWKGTNLCVPLKSVCGHFQLQNLIMGQFKVQNLIGHSHSRTVGTVGTRDWTFSLLSSPWHLDLTYHNHNLIV